MIIFAFAALALHQSFQPNGSFVRTVDRTDGVSVSQTETVELTSPGKPDVWLVGVAHIGMKKYYSDLQAILDARDVVLFEGVKSKNSPPKPPAGGKPGPKAIYQVLSDAIGLDFQLVDINYSNPHWINSDLSMEQLEAMNKKGGHGKPTSFDMVEKMLDPNSEQSKMFAQFFSTASPSIKNALKIFLVQKLSKVDTLLPAATDPSTLNILLTERNKSILTTFEKVVASPAPPASVGIFYGAAHMKEVEKMLANKYGYKRAQQEWFTFAKADKHSLDAAGKQFLDVLEKMGNQM